MRGLQLDNHPPPGLHHFRRQEVQQPAHGRGAAARQGPRQRIAQQRIQVAGQCGQVEIQVVGARVAAGQHVTAEIRLQLFDTILAGLTTLVVPMHDLAVAPAIVVGRDGAIHVVFCPPPLPGVQNAAG